MNVKCIKRKEDNLVAHIGDFLGFSSNGLETENSICRKINSNDFVVQEVSKITIPSKAYSHPNWYSLSDIGEWSLTEFGAEEEAKQLDLERLLVKQKNQERIIVKLKDILMILISLISVLKDKEVISVNDFTAEEKEVFLEIKVIYDEIIGG